MAHQGFEPFLHVPQQSRRDKLRVVLDSGNTTTHNNNSFQEQNDEGLLPSLIPSSYMNNNNNLFRRNNNNPVFVKQEGRIMNMNSSGYYYASGGFINNSCNSASSASSSSSSSSTSQQQQQNPYSVDPSSIQEMNNHFLYTSREFDPPLPFNHRQGGEVDTVTATATAATMYRPSQSLSLSLSSHHQQHQLNPARSCGGTTVSNDIRSAVPLGPFTGYASILKGSRFLIPALQLLEDSCRVGSRGAIYVERNSGGGGMETCLMENFNENGSIVDELIASSDQGEQRKKKTKLITLLDEVYRRYKLYYQQLQTIVSSFESVAGLANAAPYTSYAIKAMSKHFQCLKNAIIDQLRFTSKSPGEGSCRKDEALRSGTSDVWVHGPRGSHSPFLVDHQPVWRPQRGLPERAVAVLRAWLFEHFLHPYPTDSDKQMLAKQTGLNKSQVSNWFINARVRLWKPMVEEIHMLETTEKSSGRENNSQNTSNQNESFPSENSSQFPRQTQMKSTALKAQEHLSKRNRSSESLSIQERTSQPMNFPYNNLSSSSHHNNMGTAVGSSGGNNGVSLTLGLQQNNTSGLSEALPINIARRFGLEASNEGFIGSFETPNHHHFSSRMLHDFVG